MSLREDGEEDQVLPPVVVEIGYRAGEATEGKPEVMTPERESPSRFFKPRSLQLDQEVFPQNVGASRIVEEQIQIAVVVHIDPGGVLEATPVDKSSGARFVVSPVVQVRLAGPVGEGSIAVVAP